MTARKQQQVQECLQNQYWLGLAWREAFVVPFFPSSMPGWSDALGNPIDWDSPPKRDGDDGWYVVTSHATDVDGWMYGTNFERLQYDRPGGRASKRAGDSIRSRLWRRAPSQQGKEHHKATVEERPGVVRSTKRAVAAIGSSIQQAATQKATLGSLWVTVSELLRDAANRHKAHNLAALDITGWYVTIGSHAEVMKKQQLGQLRNLAWFNGDAALTAALKQSRGVEVIGCGGGRQADEEDGLAGPGPGSEQQRRQGQQRQHGQHGSSQHQGQQKSHKLLPGQPTQGFLMHISAGSSSSEAAGARAPGSAGKGGAAAAAGASTSLDLRVWGTDLLQEMLSTIRFALAAYGYVAAAGHLSSAMNVFKLLATLPMFDPITGVSLQANTQALLTLAGLAEEDIVMVEWANTTFRPCHYVALDHAHKRIVLAIRGSLELGDICTDLQAAPLDFDFRGVQGKVHQGLMSAATYVHSNTAEALAAAAQAHPGWPLLITGHSLGGGVAALVTLLCQLPGGSPKGLSSVRCICHGPAAVLSKELADACKDYIVSVVLGCDPIPRLSQYSVERLLLNLVDSSLSRRAAKTLADTTSDTLNAISAGFSRIASSTGAPFGSPQPVSALPTIELASLLALRDDGLKLLPRVMGTGDKGTAGDADAFDWSALHRHYAQKWSGDDEYASSEPCSPSKASVTHASATPTDMQQQQGCCQQPDGQQQQQQGLLSTLLRVGSRGGSSHSSPGRPMPKLPGKAVTVTTVTIKPSTMETDSMSGSISNPSTSPASASMPATSSQAPLPANTAALAPPPGAATAAALSATAGGPASSQLVPAAAANRASKPGGAKQLGGRSNYAAIFPKVDEDLLISNIHEAYRDIQKGSTSPPCGPGFPLKLPDRAAADGMSPPPSPSMHSRRPTADKSPAPPPPPPPPAAAAAAEGGHGAPGASTARPRSRSEPSFSWAPNSPELPSWLRMPSLSSRSAASGGGEGQEGGMSSLEEDLQHVVHLYPPGRVLWILSDDIVGPAGNQLVQAVEAHLPGPKRRPPPATARRSSAEQPPAEPAACHNSTEDAGKLQAPDAGPMDAGVSQQGAGGSQQRRTSGHAPVVVTPAAAAEAERVRAAAAQQAGQVLGQATDSKAKEAAAEAIHIAESPKQSVGTEQEAGPAKRARLQELPSQPQQQQQQQQRRRSSAGALNRASSMEVDGSTAGPGSDDFVFVPSQPPELQQLMALLGSAVDAGSAIAIAHKRTLLLEHFRQQQVDLTAKELAQQQQEQQELQERQSIHRQNSLAHQPDGDDSPQVELASAAAFVAAAEAAAATSETTADDDSQANTNARVMSGVHAGTSLQPHIHQDSVLSDASLAVREAAAEQQQLQLATFQQSDEYMEWRQQQEELNRQLLQRQQSQEVAGPSSSSPQSDTGATAGGLVGGLQGAALESLIELASLPERLTDGLMSLRLNSALCVPGLLGSPGAGSSGAAAEADARRRPVVVEPDADAFSQLLLHKNAIQDHIPDRYLEAIQRLVEWYS